MTNKKSTEFYSVRHFGLLSASKIPNLKDLALRTTTFFRFFIERKRNEWNAGEVSLISEFELFRKKVTSSMMVINDQHLMASASVGPGPKLLECLEV